MFAYVYEPAVRDRLDVGKALYGGMAACVPKVTHPYGPLFVHVCVESKAKGGAEGERKIERERGRGGASHLYSP